MCLVRGFRGDNLLSPLHFPHRFNRCDTVFCDDCWVPGVENYCFRRGFLHASLLQFLFFRVQRVNWPYTLPKSFPLQTDFQVLLRSVGHPTTYYLFYFYISANSASFCPLLSFFREQEKSAWWSADFSFDVNIINRIIVCQSSR